MHPRSDVKLPLKGVVQGIVLAVAGSLRMLTATTPTGASEAQDCRDGMDSPDGAFCFSGSRVDVPFAVFIYKAAAKYADERKDVWGRAACV